MVNDKLIKQTVIVYAAIEKKLVDPTFKISGGGATTRIITASLKRLEEEFGAISSERLVDYCISTAYFHRDKKKTLNHIFGPKSIERMKEHKRGIIFYQDEWLESGGLSRASLVALIKDRQKHPHDKYIYVAFEEPTKLRHINQKVGYYVCQASTLGWSPLSDACSSCVFVENCKKETERKYPEIYRLRIENGTATRK